MGVFIPGSPGETDKTVNVGGLRFPSQRGFRSHDLRRRLVRFESGHDDEVLWTLDVRDRAGHTSRSPFPPTLLQLLLLSTDIHTKRPEV